MNILSRLQKSPTFINDINEIQKEKASFHVGKITQVNEDLTCSIQTASGSEYNEINVMLSCDEKIIEGGCILFKSSSLAHKSQVEILGKSPWMV